MTNYAPIHRIDDGLQTAARAALTALMRRVCSREIRQTMGPDPFARAPKWSAMTIAFIGFFEKCPPRVRTWLQRGDFESNCNRLACAMGIQSLYSAKPIGFLSKMVREPLGLDADETAAIKAFVPSRETVLPEL